MVKRVIPFDAPAPPPAPPLRSSNFQSKPFYPSSVENVSYNNESYSFKLSNQEMLNVFDVVKDCGIAVPSIFGPVIAPTEYHQKVLKSYYYTIRIILFYHYRKGGTLESIVKNRDNLIVFNTNFDSQTLICTTNSKLPNSSSNYFDKWHLIYHERKSSEKLIIFRSIRTSILNDYAKYLLSLLNISTKTASHILTMLLYKTLSCSENSFLKLVKTLFSSFTNFHFSLLAKIAIEFVKRGNLPIMTLRKLADRWLPIFISQEVPNSEDLFIQLILSSPDQIPHFHTAIGDDTCIKCSNSILFSLSLLRTTRQFLTIIAKYPLVSKISFAYFASLAKDERFGEYGLMLKTEATNAIVQLWLSPARAHVLTLGPYVVQILGEISRLQTIQINVWKYLLEDVDDRGFKLIDVMIGNPPRVESFRILNEVEAEAHENLALSARFLRPYCVNSVNAIEKNFFLAPLIVSGLLSLRRPEYHDVLVKLLVDAQEQAPLSYLCSARLSLFIPWLSFQHLMLLKLNIGGLLPDGFVSQYQDLDYNKLPNRHIHDLGDAKDFYLALPDMYDYSPPLGISQILFNITRVDRDLCVSLLDYLVQLILYYYQSPDLSYLSCLLSEGGYPPSANPLLKGEKYELEGKSVGDEEGGLIELLYVILGVSSVSVSLSGLCEGMNEIESVDLDIVLSSVYPISPYVKVVVNVRVDGVEAKMRSLLLHLLLVHLLEFRVYRHINGGYYKSFLLKNYDKLLDSEKLGDKNKGTLHPKLEAELLTVSVPSRADVDLSCLKDFIGGLLKSSECRGGMWFDEYVDIMVGRFDEISFDELNVISNEYGYIGKLITSYFLARVLVKYLYPDEVDSETRFSSDMSKYSVMEALLAVKHNRVEVSGEVPPFLMNDTEFNSLVKSSKIRNVNISPFNIVTESSVSLSKWQSDWILVTAKVVEAMSALGSAKASDILEKINRDFCENYPNKISINDKKDLRSSCLVPFSIIDNSLNKIADYFQTTNNVEYAFTALDALWSLIISSLPRVDLISGLIKILLTANQQIGKRQIYTLKMKYLNDISFLICFTVLLWIAADPLQSLAAFRQVAPPGGPSAIVLWNCIEKFLKTGLVSKASKCKFNQANFKISELTLPLAYKIFMGSK